MKTLSILLFLASSMIWPTTIYRWQQVGGVTTIAKQPAPIKVRVVQWKI